MAGLRSRHPKRSAWGFLCAEPSDAAAATVAVLKARAAKQSQDAQHEAAAAESAATCKAGSAAAANTNIDDDNPRPAKALRTGAPGFQFASDKENAVSSEQPRRTAQAWTYTEERLPRNVRKASPCRTAKAATPAKLQQQQQQHVADAEEQQSSRDEMSLCLSALETPPREAGAAAVDSYLLFGRYGLLKLVVLVVSYCAISALRLHMQGDCFCKEIAQDVVWRGSICVRVHAALHDLVHDSFCDIDVAVVHSSNRSTTK
jgi:hypothetical protein